MGSGLVDGAGAIGSQHPDFTEVRLLEDCARNLRIAYRLPVAVSEPFLVAAGADRVTVNRFSTFVAGASDHLVAHFELWGPVRLDAVDGSVEVTVTYGSLGGRARPEAVMTVEGGLRRAIASDLPDKSVSSSAPVL